MMDINEDVVLAALNKFIVTNRLNKIQILGLVELVSISKDIYDLEDNLYWEISTKQ